MEEHNHGEENTNCIINYLPQNMTDEEFRSLFLSIGPIKNSKIIRDKSTGYSYGFGFVDFHDPQHAKRACETMCGLQLQSKRIKVAIARKGGDDIKGANVYVRNLPQTWKEAELNKLFEPYGKIIQSRVLIDLCTGVSKRVGFVLFDTRDEAEQAIQCLNGKCPEGFTETIVVKFADDNSKKIKQQQQMNIQYIPIPNFCGAPGPMRHGVNRIQRFNPMAGALNYQQPTFPQQQQTGGYTLFVYNIGSNATDRTLWAMFKNYGTVQKVNVMMDHEKNQCKGFGFVTMTNYTEAQNAIQVLNGQMYQGKQLQVSFKHDKNQQPPQQQQQQMGMQDMNMMCAN